MRWIERSPKLAAFFQKLMTLPVDPSDIDGPVRLMLCAVDNLRRVAPEAKLSEIARYFSDEQAAFLLKLADNVRREREF